MRTGAFQLTAHQLTATRPFPLNIQEVRAWPLHLVQSVCYAQ